MDIRQGSTTTHEAGEEPRLIPGHVVDDEILAQAIADCEEISRHEMAGRSESWPSTAAVAYWQNAQTLRRILAAPHHP